MTNTTQKRSKKEKRNRNKLIKLIFQQSEIFENNFKAAITFEENDKDNFDRKVFYIVIADYICTQFLKLYKNKNLIYDFITTKPHKFPFNQRPLIAFICKIHDPRKDIFAKHIMVMIIYNAFITKEYKN